MQSIQFIEAEGVTAAVVVAAQPDIKVHLEIEPNIDTQRADLLVHVVFRNIYISEGCFYKGTDNDADELLESLKQSFYRVTDADVQDGVLKAVQSIGWKKE